MIIIADSGSTRTTWSIHYPSGDGNSSLHTSGINPFYQDEEEIFTQVKTELPGNLGAPSTIYFYGAGCANSTVNQKVEKALKRFFLTENIHVESDLLAAARALCQRSPGIACILGTGSNSCYYNGSTIEKQVSPLGFILGDEGSGAVIGKRLLADILKNQLPREIIQLFYDHYKVSQAEILENIYRKPFPNRYAAQFTRFIGDNISFQDLRALVADEFGRFFQRNILQYREAMHCEIHFTGSIAWHFRDILTETANRFNFKTGKIIQAPMTGLLEYHLAENS